MTSVEIYINGEMAVYDDQTAIGTIIRNFDFTDPGNRKQPYTNNLKLPVRENQHIFQFASEPGYIGSIPYTKVEVEIFVDGYFLLKKGIGYLTSVSGGYYHITIRDQPDVIQTMKTRTLASLAGGSSTPIATPIVQTLLNATSGTKIDFIFNEAQRLNSVVNPANFYMPAKSANFTYYVHSVFARMTTVDGITFAGGLMTDSNFLNLRLVSSLTNVNGVAGDTHQVVSQIIVNSEKSFFDLFKAVLQKFGAIYTISGTTITIERYDDLTLNKVSWAGKLQKINKKSFSIPGIAQNNYLRCKTGGEADETLNEAVWLCNNMNIEYENVPIKPDQTVYPFLNLNGLITGAVTGDNAIYLPDSDFGFTISVPACIKSIVNPISDFVFVVDGAQMITAGTVLSVQYYVVNLYTGPKTANHTILTGDNRTIATYYNSQNDYLSFEAMIADPVVYEVEMNLDVLDLHNFNVLDLVIVPELAGEFYVNSLQYNFDKGGRSSRAVLIKYVAP